MHTAEDIWAEVPAPTSVDRMKRLWNHHQFRKLARYSAVSLVFVPLGQVLLQLFHWWLGIAVVPAQLIAATILTPPNFLANKFYVWRHANRDKVRTEAVVFWVAAVLGTAFAAFCLWLVDGWLPEDSTAAWVRAVGIFAAQLLGYGIVWVARFIFLDKLVFTVTHLHADDEAASEAAEESDAIAESTPVGS
ncbi:MAG: GtrA family protein [Microthrixaceae bacterium]